MAYINLRGPNRCYRWEKLWVRAFGAFPKALLVIFVRWKSPTHQYPSPLDRAPVLHTGNYPILSRARQRHNVIGCSYPIPRNVECRHAQRHSMRAPAAFYLATRQE